jgi:Fungal specific transcription factor domain
VRLQCDGEKPACESCSIVYKTHCAYDIDSDHRRKGALKRDIRQLEEENEKRDIILDALRKGTEADVDDIIQLIRSDESYDSIIETIKRMPIKPAPKPEASPTLEGELAAFTGKPSLKRACDNRHYGHTSNLALAGSDDELPLVAVDHIGTWTKVTSDVDLIKHLLSLYFTWSHPIYLLFSEEVFFYALNNKKLKWCSPMLVNACLALGSNYSDRPEARADINDPATVGDHFFAEAKRLLNEDDRSCLTTIQALGVMSCRQAMMGQDSSGWRYAGQMMTMAIELGLHLTYNVQPSGKVTDCEMEARRITFWGSYMLETIYAMCVGRISGLPRMAIQLEKSVPRENLEKKIWKPHGDPRFLHEPTGLEQPAFTYTVQVQSSRLTEIVNDTLQMFYAPRDRITSRKLEVHHERFIQWHDELPSSMTIKRDGPTLPQVIALQ